jgi:hypothetical protein
LKTQINRTYFVPKFIVMNKIVLLCAMITSFAVYDCSGKLTREEAKKLIIAKMGFPQINSMNFPKKFSYCSNCSRRETYGISESGVIELLYSKMVDGKERNDIFVFTNSGEEDFGKPIKIVSLNERNKKYILKVVDNGNSYDHLEIKLGMIAFGEIKSIVFRDNDNVAEVEYSMKNIDLTPIGELIQSSGYSIVKRISTAESIGRITLEKTDRGWRIRQ